MKEIFGYILSILGLIATLLGFFNKSISFIFGGILLLWTGLYFAGYMSSSPFHAILSLIDDFVDLLKSAYKILINNQLSINTA